ncbi:uncharacterized protein VDAG_00853 [Verticillium dahliae VdLs.17]|uniref:Uncharacterized protein n=1 Tax=Verticillium dahliae (strain VdLs.17 / ATCC MYA-4575 / FGSC 10137) TaxID=498257 RepID=G2WSS2_VERDV|nr:uncharacterized protein VDAG_00853 [Verticillium dahliae VdLs.17]EGY17171.1 hypothetical protein VDAG_00853 [Verticillium dahliae VdLs.17]KAH6701737.1 hypothetical protein EV126DRAFT_339262 [Verticillium dahliae]
MASAAGQESEAAVSLQRLVECACSFCKGELCDTFAIVLLAVARYSLLVSQGSWYREPLTQLALRVKWPALDGKDGKFAVALENWGEQRAFFDQEAGGENGLWVVRMLGDGSPDSSGRVPEGTCCLACLSWFVRP